MPAPAPDASLAEIELFSGLSDSQKSEIAVCCAPEIIERGQDLVRQGDAADALYLVSSGRFAVLRNGQDAPVTEIGAGQPIGEIAFLNGGLRTATVRALRDSLVMRLDREAFTAVCTRNPGIWHALSQMLARRLAETTALAKPVPAKARPRTIAIIPAGGSELPEAIVNGIIHVFAANARTRVVRPPLASEAIAPGDPRGDGPDATRALNALESRHDYVLLLADQAPSAWSDKILHHADLVLAVGHHAADPTPNPLENLTGQYLPPSARRLVLVHPARKRVSGTSRWLEARSIAMHHHVALDNDEDIERLFRFVHGTARGLIACGGGALCAAHVGVYKALLEAGHRFDILGGTSGGSAMMAGFALGSTPDDMDRAIHDMFVTHKAMRRYTVPRYSLLDHTNFDRQLGAFFGGVDIEDMWLPFFAVSTNLSRMTRHCHRQGDLWTALRASASIPVLLPPMYTDDGEMLVDGCLLDNVPVQLMHDIKSGPNVVVSFTLPELQKYEVDYATLPSRSALLRRAMTPLGRSHLPEAPGLISVLTRSLMAGRQDFKRHLTPDDMLLVPPIPKDMGFLDWHRHGELFELGYRWTKAELGQGG
jgi:NTE family protein